MAAYKTLVFTDDREKTLGPYAILMDNELFGSNIPRLMPMSATMKGVQDLNPKMNLSGIQMVTVRLRHIH